ncbi:MAG TPA: MBL fold metallo-hydrolase [Jiangellales bacterium]|nr:MBL fold metallo-hydrolase [Jiangellales bacterium]
MTTLPQWCTLVRADNPSPMTLDGTNTYVLATAAGNIVVDPGPLLDDHLESVAGLGPVTAVLLTHRHPDHAESARRFHKMTQAPTLARDPDQCIDADPLSSDGAILDVPDLQIRVLHTPGHTADSVCFDVVADADRALLTGDTILGRGTTVVAYPDGRLGSYLDSLRRLSRLAGVLVLPGHGPVRPDAGEAAAKYLAHRQERLDQVRTAVAAGATTAPEIVEVVYADVDRALWPAAELSVRAQLQYLAESRMGDA